MANFIVKKLNYNLNNNAGLVIVGDILKKLNITKRIDLQFPCKGSLTSDIFKSYLGLLCLGKNDFAAITEYRYDTFFKNSLDIKKIPSTETLRQRMDQFSDDFFDFVNEINYLLLKNYVNGVNLNYGQLPSGYTRIDIDTFTMNNSNSKKEHVGKTYSGVFGYCPIALYIGNLGYCLELALRPGSQHSAMETKYDLERILPIATDLVKTPLLLNLDSGFCGIELFQAITNNAKKLNRTIDFIIKWNQRRTPIKPIIEKKLADDEANWVQLREGKRICIWHEELDFKDVSGGSKDEPINPSRVYRLIERTMDNKGQQLLIADYELDAWTTTLNIKTKKDIEKEKIEQEGLKEKNLNQVNTATLNQKKASKFTCEEIINLYKDHGTHEQYHSEFKSDMDLERLPSGKFNTNFLICQIAVVALNILRIIGQSTLIGKDSPIQHKAERRRIKTVLQDIMYRACRIYKIGKTFILGLGDNDKSFDVFKKFHDKLRRA